jgi:P4 family phage/plasmid primase-like protien
MTPAADLAASLRPLYTRVRTDVTAVKRGGAQAWTREKLTKSRLEAHVDGSGPARGVSQIAAGSSVTRVAVLDFDSHGGESTWEQMVDAAARVADTLQLMGGEPIAWRSSGGRGVHLYLIWDEGQDAYSVREWLKAALQGSGFSVGTKGVAAGQVELFPKQDEVPADGFGNQVVLPLAGASVPLRFDDLVGGWVAGDRESALDIEWRASEPVPFARKPDRAAHRVGAPVTGFDELCALIDAIPNSGSDALDYDEWWRVVAAVHHETDGSDIGLQLAHEFSSKSEKYDPGFLDERVWPFIRSDGRAAVIGLGTLQRIAARYGWQAVPVDADVFDDVSELDPRPPSAWVGGGVEPEPASGRVEAAAHVPENVKHVNGNHAPELLPKMADKPPVPPAGVAIVKRRGIPEAHHLTTDQANANRLVNAFGRLVFVAAGRWHVWDGRRWLADEADVYRYGCQLSDIIRAEAVAVKAKASVLDAAAQAKAADVASALMKWAVKSEMKGTIEAAIGLARKMLTVDAGALDRDAYALNVSNGIVDLRTGKLRPHNPDELITKLVPVRYVEGAQCAGWLGALSAIAMGNADWLSFMQRWAGYCLTGSVDEQAFVVHWGGGANGKSTVLEMLAETLGDYAGVAAPGLLAASKGGGDRHPTEIAALMGRRMVTAHESGEGVVLREDFIKQATGSDRLTARFMRADFFDFAPTHKLQLLTNHKPQVKGQDRGIWRRVLLVPYLAVFGDATAVREGRATGIAEQGLLDRLRGELEGILAWRVRGAVEWAAGGLNPPALVREASAAYKAEQDRVGQFVAECCERGPVEDGPEGKAWLEPLTDAMGGLYPAFVAWCKEGGVFPISKARFADDVLRVVGVGATVERRSSAENGRRRRLTCIPGIRLLSE